jgi:hypothetical protein
MSSPAQRRRGRSSKNPTASPSSSSRQEPPSSPTFQATPRASRRLMAEGAAPSLSPIFFQSSPTKGDNNAETPDERMADASSTVDDGDRTPRGNPGVRGMNFCFSRAAPFFMRYRSLTTQQILLLFIIFQVLALLEALVDLISVPTSAPMH